MGSSPLFVLRRLGLGALERDPLEPNLLEPDPWEPNLSEPDPLERVWPLTSLHRHDRKLLIEFGPLNDLPRGWGPVRTKAPIPLNVVRSTPTCR